MIHQNDNVFPKREMQRALREALPENDQPGVEPSKGVGFIYVPPSHARALDPNQTLVEGIRGAGKSFWWAALASKSHRDYVTAVFPEARIGTNLDISQAFGTQCLPERTPSKDTLMQLTDDFEPRQIWRSVVATHLEFKSPFPKERKWRDKVQWVKNNPEEYDELFYRTDETLVNNGKQHLILFDALDRLADDWPRIRPLARSLLQLALDLRSSRAIRAKLFVRPDMLEDREILAFPDSSKLTKIALTWRRIDLYALLFQCLGNAPTDGAVFRKHSTTNFGLTWSQDPNSSAWVLPNCLRIDEDIQKQLFHAIAGPTMASGSSGHKRGFPYTWLPNHLLDGRDQVSPRSFCAALRHAVQSDNPEDWSYPLHFKSIQSGVQEASRIRVSEMTSEDYPWVQLLMEPLRGKITVPCEPIEIANLWESSGVMQQLRQVCQDTAVKLLPQHLNDGFNGLFLDLKNLGLIQQLSDSRIQMPDVYRIAFGLGRRGGVKPLK
jgi:hypothetical protein